MHIGPLPAAFRDIRDDGRTNQEIIAALETHHVAVFIKHLLNDDNHPVPPPGTPYHFLATVGCELPQDTRASVHLAYYAAARQNGSVRRASPRSALLLMERMVRERYFADVFVMHEPIRDPRDGRLVFLGMGYEDEERVPWVAAVADNHVFKFDNEVILFLGPDA